MIGSKKSFRYVMHLYPDRSVHGLVLAGGGSNLDGLAELLGEMLGISVQRASADRLPVASENHPVLGPKALTGMLACLGLGYGEFYP